jgi:hypothetical protein
MLLILYVYELQLAGADVVDAWQSGWCLPHLSLNDS